MAGENAHDTAVCETVKHAGAVFNLPGRVDPPGQRAMKRRY